MILLFSFHFFHRTIGLLLGTLVAFQVVIGDLAPALVRDFTGVQVSKCQLAKMHEKEYTVQFSVRLLNLFAPCISENCIEFNLIAL